ncbi:MAG TPA: sigma factor-like helix-turn-helix DNA-binding protein, partial [Ktedonobacteraceae bacterium]|nr:sigma factor-like helix-turn-helix DNA-binding protein [Ktedonobacteraceae bacterium]
ILIEQALSILKPVDAAALQLHFGNGFTYEEIGEVMEMSSEAVRKRVARGVEKFRRVYGKKLSSTSSHPFKSSVKATPKGIK